MNKIKNKNPHITLSLNMFARSAMWALGVITLLSFVTSTHAIIVCHDYALYRATGKDPRSKTSTENSGTGITEIRKILGELKYQSYPITVSASKDSGEAAKHLKTGDVIILRNDHSGYVNDDGTIDHFIQVSDLSKANRLVVKYNAWDLPRHPLPDGKFGGLFLRDSLTQFLSRPFYKGPVGYLEVWRKEKNISDTWTNLAGNWESDYAKNGTWKPTTITQSGESLSITNEFGDTSPGVFISKTTVQATKWEGGLKAAIANNGNTINWNNGTIWRRRQQ